MRKIHGLIVCLLAVFIVRDASGSASAEFKNYDALQKAAIPNSCFIDRLAADTLSEKRGIDSSHYRASAQNLA